MIFSRHDVYDRIHVHHASVRLNLADRLDRFDIHSAERMLELFIAALSEGIYPTHVRTSAREERYLIDRSEEMGARHPPNYPFGGCAGVSGKSGRSLLPECIESVRKAEVAEVPDGDDAASIQGIDDRVEC